mgnify:CR=1 FL=1
MRDINPPAPLVPLPTVIVTEPPVPAVAAPVPIKKRPLVPELAVPELNTKVPLTPADPAFADRTRIAPLDVAVPSPVVIEINPPV